MSTLKKTSIKTTEQPVDILQDLPSTSKQSHICDTPKKRRLMPKVQALRTKLWRKQQFTKPRNKAATDSLVAQLKQYLPVETVNFIERQIMLHCSKKFQCGYAIKDKMLAHSIFYQSRKAYKLLSKLFTLKSKRTLQNSLQNTKVMPGFNEPIFDTLEMKTASMDDKDKCVALIFDKCHRNWLLCITMGRQI